MKINKTAVFRSNITSKIYPSNTIFSRFDRVTVSFSIYAFCINCMTIHAVHFNYISFTV